MDERQKNIELKNEVEAYKDELKDSFRVIVELRWKFEWDFETTKNIRLINNIYMSFLFRKLIQKQEWSNQFKVTCSVA